MSVQIKVCDVTRFDIVV